MKLCFPVESENGLESVVYTHFGSAPMFVLVDTETNRTEIIDNGDMQHIHGMCSPIQALNGNMIDAILVGGIGAGAIGKLNAMGIKVFRAIEDTVQKNIELFNRNSLPEIKINDACGQHGGCGH